MSKFRKKPVVIDAWKASQILYCAKNAWANLPKPIMEAYDAGEILFLLDSVEIKTLEGTMKAEPADWIIRGVKGELYPCKPDIFEATYDPVEE